MKLSDEKKLDLLFKYSLSMRDSLPKDIHNKFNTYKIFTYFVNLCKANRFPQVLSDDDFDELKTPIEYRGAREIDHHANLLCDYDYHYGYGIYGSGTYITDDLFRARKYAYNNATNVMVFKFIGKVLDKKHIRTYEKFLFNLIDEKPQDVIIEDAEDKRKLEIIANYYYHIKSNKDKEFFKYLIILKDYSIIPLFLGYDAIDNNCLIILNREKIVISQSEFDRITSASKNYKGGIIDFETKSAGEFLME